MALSKSKTEDIPKDAVVISKDEALRYQWTIIKGWEKPGEVWALRHSSTIGAAMASLTGIFVNNHYRKKLRLGQYGHMSTYLPIVVIPAIFSVLTKKFFVQQDILLDPIEECPVCLQGRAAAFQVGCGVVYPSILAPLAAFMFATRHFTYQIPSVTENPKQVFQLWRKLSRPIMPTLGAILAGQALITMYITYKEIEQNVKLILKMKNMETELEEQIAEERMLQGNY